MKKLVSKFMQGIVAAPLILLSTASFADNCCLDNCSSAKDDSPPCQSNVELKGGYFIFADKNMRKVYDNAGIVQLSGACPLWNFCDNFRLDLYGSAGYMYTSGKSLGGHQHTSIWQVPVDIGLRSIYIACPEMQFYATIGPRSFYIYQHNDSDYVYCSKGKAGMGFFVNTGLNYFICENVFLDFFGEYSYEKVHFHNDEPFYYTRDLQVGGYTIGAGLGYQF
jgi:hypothetical protein